MDEESSEIAISSNTENTITMDVPPTVFTPGIYHIENVANTILAPVEQTTVSVSNQTLTRDVDMPLNSVVMIQIYKEQP